MLVRGLQAVGSFVGLAPADENDLVKRVIAVGGQTVECQTEDGGLTVDGQALVEPYIDRELPGNDSPCQGFDFGPLVVPEGNLWVMGDNRARSKDSRFHTDDEYQGTVPAGNVVGKVAAIVFPPSRWGVVSAIDPQS
ncbi:signal peptidase I [Rhodococcus erythropolis]|uniref:signal peptidase I n=1 Tax=Rhodococcus erythropolis TaxID=1833 RepID=UPI0029495E4F|nr:signal peptidase I [Rhodococcus erythropolis]MDV6278269.1 signal peptidase I [Rhodococcus erythropolis]